MVINAFLSFFPYFKMWQKNCTKIQTILFHLNIHLYRYQLLFRFFGLDLIDGSYLLWLFMFLYASLFWKLQGIPLPHFFWFLEFWHGIIARKLILVSLTNYKLYHCPLSVTVLKVHPFPLCRLFCTYHHTLYCHHISFPFFISHWETTVKSLIGTSLPIASNNPQYGAHLIYSHIFFSHTLIN